MKEQSLTSAHFDEAYALARQRFSALGVDTEQAIRKALELPLSLHCWQGDDVAGFEVKEGEGASGGGILATGNHPGRARNGDELRQDLEQVMAWTPGCSRVNLHASYAETDGQAVDRDALEPRHFARWIAWARKIGIGLDFNATNFAHPLAADGLTLAHPDKKIRAFWIAHGIACRRIAEHMARELGQPCGLNHWMPDGMKDLPADRWTPRQRLMESLDAILAAELGIDTRLCLDAVESKLFGIGCEEYVVGSFEFFCGYAITRKVRLCLDMGHFHPTETIHDKLSALLLYLDNLLIHVSRPIRWDSDHVVIFSDELRAVFLELARGRALNRVAVALDFFDASINRPAAYVIGARATRKALLCALLEPVELIQQAAAQGRQASKLALMEEMKSMPFGPVWDMLCLRAKVPVGVDWIAAMEKHEKDILLKRA